MLELWVESLLLDELPLDVSLFDEEVSSVEVWLLVWELVPVPPVPPEVSDVEEPELSQSVAVPLWLLVPEPQSLVMVLVAVPPAPDLSLSELVPVSFLPFSSTPPVPTFSFSSSPISLALSGAEASGGRRPHAPKDPLKTIMAKKRR